MRSLSLDGGLTYRSEGMQGDRGTTLAELAADDEEDEARAVERVEADLPVERVDASLPAYQDYDREWPTLATSMLGAVKWTITDCCRAKALGNKLEESKQHQNPEPLTIPSVSHMHIDMHTTPLVHLHSTCFRIYLSAQIQCLRLFAAFCVQIGDSCVLQLVSTNRGFLCAHHGFPI